MWPAAWTCCCLDFHNTMACILNCGLKSTLSPLGLLLSGYFITAVGRRTHSMLRICEWDMYRCVEFRDDDPTVLLTIFSMPHASWQLRYDRDKDTLWAFTAFCFRRQAAFLQWPKLSIYWVMDTTLERLQWRWKRMVQLGPLRIKRLFLTCFQSFECTCLTVSPFLVGSFISLFTPTHFTIPPWDSQWAQLGVYL